MNLGIDFGASLAAQILLKDVLWCVEPVWGNGAFFQLLHVNANAHRAAYQERGLLYSIAHAQSVASNVNGASAAKQSGETHSTIVVPEPRSIADTGGASRFPLAVNSDGSRKAYPVDEKVGLLAITGPLSKEDAMSMDEGTSTVRARRIIKMIKADNDVKAVRIRFDTPGGAVRGNDDLARDIRDLALTKPTYAYCEDMCASAGYYLASQCNAIYANWSALIGSNSTIMTFWDFSKMLEIAGVKVDVIVPDTAPFKGTGTPGTALSEPQRDYYKGLADNFASQFHAAIKQGRGLSDAQLAAVIDGRVFPAQEAKKLKLIDGVCSDDTVIAKLKTFRG